MHGRASLLRARLHDGRTQEQQGQSYRREMKLELSVFIRTTGTFTGGARPPEVGTSDAWQWRMESKQTLHAPEEDAARWPPEERLEHVSSFTPEPTLAVEPTSSAKPPERDRVLSLFDWFCAGPASDWERGLTRRARWRLA
jgi:hypothetical protein